MNGPNKMVPVLAGGTVLGVLSTVPGVSYLNCLCCMWVIGGGVLTVYLYLKDYPPDRIQPNLGDGALLGLLAGAWGAVVALLLQVVFYFMLGLGAAWTEVFREMARSRDVPPEFRQVMEYLAAGGIGLGVLLVVFLVSLFVFAVFGMVGGLLGMAIFQKSAPAPAVPPMSPPPGAPHVDIPQDEGPSDGSDR